MMVLRARRRSDREAAAAQVSWLDAERCLAEDRALAIDLDRALCALSAEQREVVVLHITEGMTFREIAELCAIPPDTAASRYRLAIGKMRAILKGGE